MALGLGRGRSERGSRRDISPYRLDDGLKDRHGDVAAGGAAPERTALAVGVIIADPDRKVTLICDGMSAWDSVAEARVNRFVWNDDEAPGS
jgi:hypothetical protein